MVAVGFGGGGGGEEPLRFGAMMIEGGGLGPGFHRRLQAMGGAEHIPWPHDPIVLRGERNRLDAHRRPVAPARQVHHQRQPERQPDPEQRDQAFRSVASPTAAVRRRPVAAVNAGLKAKMPVRASLMPNASTHDTLSRTWPP